MNRTPETEEIQYDFNLYFDSLISTSLDLDGQIVLIWNKGSTKRIVSEEMCKAAKKHTLIAKSINMQLPLFYRKDIGQYQKGTKANIS
jgi:hypothetical protein